MVWQQNSKHIHDEYRESNLAWTREKFGCLYILIDVILVFINDPTSRYLPQRISHSEFGDCTFIGD